MRPVRKRKRRALACGKLGVGGEKTVGDRSAFGESEESEVKVIRRVRQREGDALCVAAQVGDAGIVRDDIRGIDGQIDEHGREKTAEKRKGERDGKREALQTAAGCIRHVQTPFGHVAENATDKLAPPRPERAPPV